jgi:predicted secreted protein
MADLHAMNFRFRLGQPEQDTLGLFLYPFDKRTLLDHPGDIGVVPVRLMLFHMDRKFIRTDTLAAGFFFE